MLYPRQKMLSSHHVLWNHHPWRMHMECNSLKVPHFLFPSARLCLVEVIIKMKVLMKLWFTLSSHHFCQLKKVRNPLFMRWICWPHSPSKQFNRLWIPILPKWHCIKSRCWTHNKTREWHAKTLFENRGKILPGNSSTPRRRNHAIIGTL